VDAIHVFRVAAQMNALIRSSFRRRMVSVVNVTNNEALYNFLSTFSGTHFVTPRAYQAQVGVTF
jgi:hypothetical protein